MGWPRWADRVLSAARATYLWLPEGTILWREATTFEPLHAGPLRALFESVQ